MLTVGEVYEYINHRAPFDTQAEFDNCGLLTGTMDREVRHILVALDCTSAVLDEAERLGADLLVTHHPLMFSARKQMTEMDHEGRLLCRMIRRNMSMIAAHTNLDKAPGGINDVLAGLCGLSEYTGEDYLRVGNLAEATTAQALANTLAHRLNGTVRLMGDGEKRVRRVALSSGMGSDSWQDALKQGADAFVSGEIKHHHALALAEAGAVGLECGHFATETPGIMALADALQNHLNALQYKVSVSKSQAGAYAFAGVPVDGEV